MEAESQNFLPEHNLGKKKYETEYVRASAILQQKYLLWSHVFFFLIS